MPAFPKIRAAIRIGALMFFCIGLSSFGGLGGVGEAAPQKYAVVIGINRFADPRIRTLKYTMNDAQEVYRFLVDPRGGGFPQNNVRLLLNEQATQRAIKNAVGQFLPTRAVRGDLVFVFFAGHGALEMDRARREPDGFSKYLVPYDADSTDLFSTGIDLGAVKGFFDRMEADRIVFVLDACFAGGVGRGFAALSTRDIDIAGNPLARLEGTGRVILTAAEANELSLEVDSLRHGLFTYYFLEGLRGKADRQGRGYITIQDAYRYTYEQVARESRRLGGSQSPRLQGDLAGDIVLVRRVADPAGPSPSLVSATAPGSDSHGTGVLLVQGTPIGTTILLDGSRVGTAAADPARLITQSGTHALQFRAPGFDSQERFVETQTGQEQTIRFALRRSLAQASPAVLGGGSGCGPAVAVPTYRVGEYWAWRDRSGSRWQQEVVQVDPDYTYVQGWVANGRPGLPDIARLRNGEIGIFDRTWTLRYVLTSDGHLASGPGTGAYAYVGQRPLDFPLQAGKRWSITDVAASPGGPPSRLAEQFAVVGCEEITTAVGTLAALRIEVTPMVAAASNAREYVLWWSPQLRQYVRGHVVTVSRQEPGLEFDLVAYGQRQPVPTVSSAPAFPAQPPAGPPYAMPVIGVPSPPPGPVPWRSVILRRWWRAYRAPIRGR